MIRGVILGGGAFHMFGTFGTKKPGSFEKIGIFSHKSVPETANMVAFLRRVWYGIGGRNNAPAGEIRKITGGTTMKYPKTGSEVYMSLNLSNTMLTGIGKGTITREEVSASYLKRLFAEHGVIVSAKPEQRRLLEIVNDRYDLGLELPEQLKLFQLSEEHRRLVVVEVSGLRRKGGSLLPEYTEEEFNEATFAFVKYYVQGTHYDTLVEENKKLKFELEQELEWRNRTDNG